MVGKESELVTMYISSRDVLEWAIDKENALAHYRDQIMEILRSHDINQHPDAQSRRLSRQVRDAPDVHNAYDLLLPFTTDLAVLTGDHGLVEPYTLGLVTGCNPLTVTLLIESMLHEKLLIAAEFEGDTYFKPNPVKEDDSLYKANG